MTLGSLWSLDMHEAEALRGDEITRAILGLFQKANLLYHYIGDEIRFRRGLDRTLEETGAERRRILYAHPEGDEFRDQIADFVKVAEEILRPHLTR